MMIERRALLVVALVGLLAVACATAVPGAPSPTVTLAPTSTATLTPTMTTASPTAATSSPTPGASTQPTPCDEYYGDDCNGGGQSPTPAPPSGDATVTIVSYAPTGDYLAGSSRMALYTFDNDGPGSSSCTGNCAGTWPPLTVPMGEEPAAGSGLSGTLGVIERGDGSYQVTYDGMPLYYYSGDAALYDTTGDGIGGVWHLARP